MPSYTIVINCVDGRVQTPVLEWMKRELPGELVHAVNEPGPDGSLAGGEGAARIEGIVDLLATQTTVHAIAVAAHHDCLGNPVDAETHRDQLARAVERVAGWGHADRVLGLWVDDAWEVNLVCEADAETAVG